MIVGWATPEEYIEEKNRMFKRLGAKTSHGCNGVSCALCPFYVNNECKDDTIESVSLLAEWVNSHNTPTALELLLSKVPNAELDPRGIPKYMCPSDIGLDVKVCLDKKNAYTQCMFCWYTQID